MPFLGVDSWRWQYFEGQFCPPDVVVPIDDATAWDLHVGHRAIYNKLTICDTQGLPNGPHGTTPPRFPVFSKPIYNMRGMGTGSRVIASAMEYEESLQPGHMWMPLLRGPHVSTDMALAQGEIVWCRHTTGVAFTEGMFDYWTVHAKPKPALDAYLAAWVGRTLSGTGWLAAVVELYTNGVWRFGAAPRTGYSVVLFGAHGIDWQIDRSLVRALLETPEVSSIQITYDDTIAREAHAMPPGGFRLAIVNCWDLAVGKRVRARLKAYFDAAAEARRPRRAAR